MAILCHLLRGMLSLILGARQKTELRKAFQFMRKARDFVFLKPQLELRFARYYKSLCDVVWVDQCNVIVSLYSSATKEVESGLTL